jgi:hypothetical protein
MPEIIKDCEQGSDEWLTLRCASIGGTAIGKIAPNGKQRHDLLRVFVGELLTGQPAENKGFQFAERGHEFEDKARSDYILTHGSEVEQVAMVRLDHHKHTSPDGLVGNDGMVEIKTRIPSVFVSAIEDGNRPINVARQIQWGLYVCEREWCDYIQYCPEFAEAGLNPMIVERITRDDKLIKDLRSSADVFISDMLKMADKIKNR